jgi:hypothetical protein
VLFLRVLRQTQLLILGLAFMSVSVDVSGFFENVARRLLRQGGAVECVVDALKHFFGSGRGS